MRNLWLVIKKFDRWLVAGFVFLMLLGLLVHYSLALAGDQADFSNFYKQLFYIVLGLLSFFLFSIIDYRFFQGNSRWWMLISISLLFGVLIFGQTIRGTTGWFRLGSLQFQPVEFVKVIVIVLLANYFSRHARYLHKWRYVIFSGLGVWLLVLLVAVQPDIGSAAILLLTWLVMLMLVGLKRSQLIALFITLIIITIFSWGFLLRDYQKERLRIFVNPNSDPQGQGYNVRQAMVAIGSGRIVGRGLGFGSQSHLRFLPEAQTDFIFAVLAEELGFIGVLLTLALWLFIFRRLLIYIFTSKDDFANFILVGAIVMLLIEIGINIGMNLGLTPVTGISLPLMSYGGSSLVATCILLGIVQSIRIRQKPMVTV